MGKHAIRGALVTAVCGWIFLSVSPTQAFKPRYHGDFTRQVLGEISRTIEGHTLRFSPRAISQIVDNNRNQDDGWCLTGSPSPPFSVSANHFDGEELNAGSALVRKRLDDVRSLLTQTRADGEGARRLLGQALHGVQDYYAHSNRAESAGTADDRLGVSTFDAVGRSTATCQAPPNTGTYVAFSGLTSGYWFGCSGQDDSQLPAGKCYHGLEGFPGSNHAGTNKDAEGRPNFAAAQRLALESTRKIIDRLLDGAGVKDNLKATAALMGVTTLAFVVDDTGSMGEDIAGVQRAVRTIVNTAQVEGETPEYLLLRFGDPDIGEPFVTMDPAAFLAQVDALSPGGGGDCPELSQGALLKAVGASVPGASMFLFSDASAKDAALGATTNALARERDIRISPVLTGSCSPVDPVYKRNATETGGQLFFVDRGEVESLFALVAPQVTGDFETLLLASGSLAGASRDFPIAIDSTVRRAVFSVAIDTLTAVTVIRPDGHVVAAGEPGVSTLDLSSGRVVTVDSPGQGTWTLQVRGSGEYSVAAQGNTNLFVESFEFAQYGNPKHPGFFSIGGQPLGGQSVTAVARLGGATLSAAFDAVAMDATVLSPLPLATGHPDAEEGDYTGTFEIPNTAFRVLVRGKDAGGVAFQRMVPKLIRPQVARVVIDLASVPDAIPAGRASTLRFSVLNFGPPALFDITARDDRGFVRTVSPQTLSLDASGSGIVEVTIVPPSTTADGTSIRVTLLATMRGQPDLANSATVDLIVRTNGAPVCDAARPDITSMWPPNGRFVPVRIAGVTDPDGDAVDLVITEVRQDEQPQFGPANRCGDAEGVGSSSVSLAAAREGAGDGRVYHLFLEASDGRGGSCQATVRVCVPHDQRTSTCIDQGAQFNSLGACR